MSDEVLVESRDGVTVVTINRPRARNAVNGAVSAAMAAAFEEFEARKDVSVAIVTGAGGTFCSGMDLKAFLAGEDVLHPERGLAGITRRPPRKPVIAAVEGYALAGGCEVVLACDLVVAAENAKFGIPEVKRGLVAGAGGLLRLPHRIPRAVAMELALTGDFLDAAEAKAHGLVNKVTEAGGALAGAWELAARIAANGPLAVAATKEILVGSRDWTEEEGWSRQDGIMQPVFASADAREGATAFAEKRPPVWRGE
ncbi:crotonase/enoyl-CoA hydratase family protein [Peterkaempfera bronchialis]|uniref:Enoyl-CoA hydratase n=1 Tax=Peterkaempfera bronchialis TaxID=2126346 RepID=A0A345SR26_9ACTN|nr:crotonase/enoyl-CoA hydratase family protein [Peterkaempfera bronchialis]AXI76181.1 enoyl-CoA hydratase [Peterkaempfera bronchialis]